MPTQDEVAQQERLLETHRRTLAHYLVQRAELGIAYTPPAVLHGIDEARNNIRRIKGVLCDWGIDIADHPDDEEEDVVRLPSSPSTVPIKTYYGVNLFETGEFMGYSGSLLVYNDRFEFHGRKIVKKRDLIIRFSDILDIRAAPVYFNHSALIITISDTTYRFECEGLSRHKFVAALWQHIRRA